MSFRMNQQIAQDVLRVVDKGLVCGLGDPKPGKMCVEAAVCYALGEPHSDEPSCVVPFLRNMKIGLNDCRWSSKKARTRGLRRVAIAQLGTTNLDLSKFFRAYARQLVLCDLPSKALRTLIKGTKNKEHKAKLAEFLGSLWMVDHSYKQSIRVIRQASAWISDNLFTMDELHYCDQLLQEISSFHLRGQAAIGLSNRVNEVLCTLEFLSNGRKSGDEYLNLAAEAMEAALVDLKTPGSKYLYLTY